MNEIVTHKKCSSCGVDQLLSEFPADPRYKTGVRSNCKECYRINAYKYRKPKVEKEKKVSIKRVVDKAKQKIWKHASYLRHKATTLLNTKIYRKEHPEVSRKATAKWRENNYELSKEVQRQAESKRRASKRNSLGNITRKEWKLLLEKYDYKCLCCGRSDVNLQMDHVVPLFSGGEHRIENIQPLCKSCNCKKHVKTIDYRS